MKKIVSDNSKVMENYFFMTFLQGSGMLIGLVMYPYLIRTLGKESFGLYVFALSVTSFFVIFIGFGFNLPGTKKIVENKDNLEAKNRIVSGIFTAKCYLALIATLVFFALLVFVPKLSENRLIYLICYTQILAELLFPVWYFQAVQKMKIVTIINLTFRLISIPFVFIFIQSPAQNWVYALIGSSTVVAGCLAAQYQLWKKEKIALRFVPLRSLGSYFREALPFFWSISTGTVKQESVTLIIGTFFGMGDVALYDLANKIILIPRMITTGINRALFPKVIENARGSLVKKIIRYETWIGIIITAGIALFGYWVVLFLGGVNMLTAYPLAIILSTSILVWLVVGCYINFIFIPQNRYYFVTQNQFAAFFSFFFFCSVLFFFNHILTVVSALALSGFCEIIYCKYLIRKHHLL